MSAEFVGCGSEIEIFLSDAAGVVCDEGEADLVVTDVDIGVVTGRFGEVADFIDKGERCAEILEQESADEFPRFDLPVGDSDKAGMDFVIGESGHGRLLKSAGPDGLRT
jgi:hypothetical protein